MGMTLYTEDYPLRIFDFSEIKRKQYLRHSKSKRWRYKIVDIIMKKILFIIGSLRKGSFNHKLAVLAEQLIAGRAEVEY